MRSRTVRRVRRALGALATTPRRRRVLQRRGAAIRRLETAPLFLGLPNKALALVARGADPIEFPSGAVIVDERRPLPQFIVLTSGVAEQTLGGKRIGVIGAGDHFGELTLLGGEPHVPTVTALTDVEGFVLGRREFWGALHLSPALSIRLTASLAEHLRRAQRRLAATSTETVSRTVRLNPASSDVGSGARR